jgi:hypothetical protein
LPAYFTPYSTMFTRLSRKVALSGSLSAVGWDDWFWGAGGGSVASGMIRGFDPNICRVRPHIAGQFGTTNGRNVA